MVKFYSLSYSSILLILFIGLLVAISIIPLTGLGKYNPRKIVVYEDSFLNESAQNELLSRHGAIKLKHLDSINGAAVLLPHRAAEKALIKNNAIKRIDEDVEVFALSHKVSAQAQILPWGIDRVDAEKVWPLGNSADPVRVGIIDTGISKDHPDLKVNIKGGVNTINPRRSWNDDNGHGSHVAGIVAALNDTTGVVGVSPLADLYAIKVLGASGSGYLSDVIEGIDWAIARGMKVVNMSLGTSSDIPSFHDAVIRAQSSGVVVVAAAGNSGGAVLYPAAYLEAIAVSATDSNNDLASFSSRGPEVDLSAPGVSIYSTYRGTGYATLSGTSMAAPHVAGAAALVLNTTISSSSDLNLNGKWDPGEVQKKLQDTAFDLGATGFDTLYGWGLVNAYNAVQ